MVRGLLTTSILLAAILAVAALDAAGELYAAREWDGGRELDAAPAELAAETRAPADPKANPDSSDTPQASGADRPAERPGVDEPTRQLFTGKVVPLLDALKNRKIETNSEELKGQVVLETAAGELIPIVPDWRGRAFFQDERLRNRKVDLVGYRPAGTPYLKVLMVFTFDEKDQRQYTDYWCDICSIPMYEIKDCECCQGPIRLRFQPQELPDYLGLDGRKEAQEAQKN